jgi:hypothetical protein
MIDIEARDKNRIVTVSLPGKTPIKIRPSSSLYFWNPVELLCGAVGGCIGGIVVDYCRYNDLDPKIFEFLGIDLKDKKIIVVLKHPKELEKEHLTRLSAQITTCEVSKMLLFPIEIQLLENTISTKELINAGESRKGCCGGT